MTLKRLLLSLGRRWYVTVAGVLATLALCAAAYMNTAPTLQRSASELLVPGSTTIPIGGNPYLYLGGLGQAADVLVSALNAEQVLDPIRQEYPGTTITVARDTGTSGPMILITVTGTKDAAVAGALDAIRDAVPATLSKLQTSAGVTEKARIDVQTLTSDSSSTVIEKARIETVGMIGVAGLVVTVLLVGLVDGLVMNRRKRAVVSAEPRRKPRTVRQTAGRPMRGDREGAVLTAVEPVKERESVKEQELAEEHELDIDLELVLGEPLRADSVRLAAPAGVKAGRRAWGERREP